VNSTVVDVSIKEGLGYEAVPGIINRRVSEKVNWKEFKEFKEIGIDEIARRKGHQDFITLVTTNRLPTISSILGVGRFAGL
jgi:hypothetical protein